MADRVYLILLYIYLYQKGVLPFDIYTFFNPKNLQILIAVDFFTIGRHNLYCLEHKLVCNGNCWFKRKLYKIYS